MLDGCWRASHYGKVYEALSASLDLPMRNVAPGAHGTIGRAIDHFRANGSADAVAALETVSLTIATLQASLRDGDDGAIAGVRHALARQARAWLLESPMFPVPSAGIVETRAA